MKLPVLPLRFLLPAAVAGLSLVLLSAMQWLTLGTVRSQTLTQTASEIRSTAAEVLRDLDRASRPGDPEGVAAAIARTNHTADADGEVFVGENGTVLAASRAEWIGRPAVDALPPELVPPNLIGSQIEAVPGSDVLVGFFPVALADRGVRGVIVVARDAGRSIADGRAEAWERFRVLTLGALALATLLGIALDRLVSRRVASLGETVDRIAAGDLTARPLIAGGDELGTLACGLYAMTARLAAASAERDRATRVLRIQNEVLAGVAEDQPLPTVLDHLCRQIEATHDLSICSVMQLTPAGTLRVVAGPNLGADARRQLDGLVPGPFAGSCGTAAFTGGAVCVCDTDTDPRWADLREVARALGVRACWSVPIADGGVVYGTFAISHLVPREATPADADLLVSAARLAAIAIRRAAAQKAIRESEDRLRLVIETEPECVKLLAPDGTVAEINRAGVEMVEATGVTEVVGKSVFGLIAPDFRDTFRAMHERVIAGESVRCEYELLGLRGGRRRLETHAVPFHPPGAAVPYHLAVTRDVTEQRQADAALRASEERFRLLAETIDEVFWMASPGLDRILYLSLAYERVWGRTRESLYADPASFVAAIHPDDRDRLLAQLGARGDDGLDLEYRIVRPDGDVRWIEDRGFPVREPDGSLRLMVGCARDVTARKLTEEALRTREAKFQAVVETAADGFWMVDPRGCLTDVNDAYARRSGYSRSELLGMTIADLEARETQADVEAHIVAIRRDGHDRFESVHRAKDGTMWPVEVSARHWPETGGSFAFLRDITERKRVEAALRESEGRLRVALRAAGAVAFEWDAATDVVVRFYSTEPALPENASAPEPVAAVRARVHPDDLEAFDAGVAACLDGGTEYRNLYRVVRPDGTTVWLEEWGLLDRDPDGRPLRLTGVSIDVTERKQAERALRMLEYTVAHFSDAVFWVGPDARVLSVNAAARDRATAPSGDPADWTVFDFDPDMGRSEWSTHWDDLKARGSVVFERRHRLADGRIIPVEISANYVNFDGTELNFATARDLTDRKRADEAFRERAALLEALVDSSPDGILVVTSAGRTLIENRPLADIWNMPPELIADPDDTARVRFAMGRTKDPEAFRSKVAQLYETPAAVSRDEIELIDGTILDRFSAPVRGATGKNYGRIWTFRDITASKRAEHALRDSEERFRAVVEAVPSGLLAIDPDGRVVLVNQRALELFGYDRADLLGRKIEDVIPARFRDTHPDDRRRYAAAPSPRPMGTGRDLYGFRKDGSEFPVEVGLVPMTSAGASLILAAVTDVTARKRSEDALRASEAEVRGLNADLERRVADRTAELSRLVAILEASPDLIAITDDPAKRLIFANAALRRLAAARRVDPAASRLADFHTPESADRLRDVGVPAATRDGVWMGETEVVGPDGLAVPVSQSIQTHPGPDGGVAYVSTIMRDISDRKRLEDELRRRRDALLSANAELAKAGRLKDEFLANMSHELRTPLNGVLAMSEALQEEVYGPLNPDQLGALRDIEQCGRHLLMLINDILDLSKIEAGQIALEQGPVDVDRLCHTALRFVRELALKKRLRVAQRIDPGLGPIVADERRLKQILVNLLSNAVKFTPDGGEIGLDVTASDDRRTVAFAVRDTGIGIRDADRGLLFRPFQQIDSRLSREYPGTGLGLALVKRMAELHGGGVAVESRPGEGSRFTVTIPWVAAPADGTPPAEPGEPVAIADPGPAAPVVLLAEDNPVNARGVRDFLRAAGFRVESAANGLDAIDAAREGRPAVILMDIQMPGLDGLEVIRRLRADAATRATPIVAVTALAMPGDRERCLEAGADDYLTKPLALRTLLATVRRFLAAPKDEAEVTSSTRTP